MIVVCGLCVFVFFVLFLKATRGNENHGKHDSNLHSGSAVDVIVRVMSKCRK